MTQDNGLRFDPRADKGHVESYFFRANDPERPRALWLKATIHQPLAGDRVAELWCIAFDGERHRTWANRATVPYEEASFSADRIEVAGASFSLSEHGSAAGELESRNGSDPCKWNVHFDAEAGHLGAPLCMLPTRRLVDAPFPKSKLLTPMPLLRFRGTVSAFGEEMNVDGWHGMQGHNWGQEHAWEYAWGQCHFLDAELEPFCTVEAFSGRLRIARRTTPIISGMVVRRDGKEYRFDRLVDLWRQSARIDDLSWTLKMRGRHGTARLEMKARPDDMVCLGYGNPDGRLSHCFNSKLARVSLRVSPHHGPSFECTSEHGGALELLRNEPDTRFSVV